LLTASFSSLDCSDDEMLTTFYPKELLDECKSWKQPGYLSEEMIAVVEKPLLNYSTVRRHRKMQHWGREIALK
jgi:hypothetical protein